ncbi:serine endoprotease [compost metagenome]
MLQAGPAAQAGMRPGDVIVQIGDKPVRNVAELLTTVASLPPGTAADFQLRRGDAEVTLKVVPAVRPSQPQREGQGR